MDPRKGKGDLARGRRKPPRFNAPELIRDPSEPAKHFKENIRWRGEPPSCKVERMVSATAQMAVFGGCDRKTKRQGLILN